MRTVTENHLNKAVHFRKEAHGLSFKLGRSWKVDLVRMLMNDHLSKELLIMEEA